MLLIVACSASFQHYASSMAFVRLKLYAAFFFAGAKRNRVNVA